MITTLILTIASFFLSIIYLLLQGITSLISFVIPNDIENAIIYAVNGLKYFQGILPISGILSGITFIIGFIILWYTAKLMLRIYSLLPGIGKHIDLSSPHQQETHSDRINVTSGKVIATTRTRTRHKKKWFK